MDTEDHETKTSPLLPYRAKSHLVVDVEQTSDAPSETGTERSTAVARSEASDTCSTRCWICHGGEASPGGEELVGDICACKNSVVHPGCLKTWLHYSKARRGGQNPFCEVCTQEYEFGFDMDKIGAARPCPERQYAANARIYFPFKQTTLPAMIGFVYGFTHDTFKCTSDPAPVATLAGNAVIVAVWLTCVVAPLTAQRLAARVAATRDISALLCVYLAVLVGWTFQKITMPGTPATTPHNEMMHIANAATFIVCTACRFAFVRVVH